LDLVVGPSNDIHCTDERRRIVTDGIACSSIQYSAALTAVTAAENMFLMSRISEERKNPVLRLIERVEPKLD
jgi:predicted deacylase